MTLELFTITPRPRGTILRSASRVHRIVAVSVTSSTAFHSSSVISTRSLVRPSPALFTTTSSGSPSSACANIRCTSSSFVTSQGIASGYSSASSEICAAASFNRPSCLSLMTTSAPSSAHRRAVANPIPAPAAAVTRTRFSPSRWWLDGYSGASGIRLVLEHVGGEDAAVVGSGAARRLEGEAALQPEVQVVLPGEPDAAVQLERLDVRTVRGVVRGDLRD